MMSKDYMLKYEFIGLDAQIEYGSVSSQRKINGKIVFETKNTISLANDLKTYVMPKKSINRLELIFKDEICLMNGSMIIGRPEDRLLK